MPLSPSLRPTARVSKPSRRTRMSIPAGRLSLFESANPDPEETELALSIWKRHRLLPPNTRLAALWKQWLLWLVGYNMFVLPLDLSFEKLANIRYILSPLEYSIDFFFLLDICLTFRTAYCDSETNDVIVDKKEIARRYLRGWFFVDVAATLPWDLISPGNDAFRPLKVVRFLRLIRILKELRHRMGRGAYFKRVLRLVTYFFFFAHWVGCLWWMIGSKETTAAVNRLVASGRPASSYSDSWLQRIPKMNWNGQGIAYPLDLQSPFLQQYLSSLYWAFTALVKVPWVAPHTVLEKAFGSFTLLVGAVFFAFLLGSVVAAVQAYDRSNARRRDVMGQMLAFSETRRLPAHLTTEVMRYVDASLSFESEFEGTERLGELPSRLRGAMLESIHAKLLAKSKLLQSVSPPVINLILQNLRPQVCLGKSRLCEPFVVPDALYFLHHGHVNIQLAERPEPLATRMRAVSASSNGSQSLSLESGSETRSKKEGSKTRPRFRPIEQPGDFVGLYDPFDGKTRVPFEVVAIKTSQFLAIDRHSLADVLDDIHEDEANAFLSVLKREYEVVMQSIRARRAHCCTGSPTQPLVREDSFPSPLLDEGETTLQTCDKCVKLAERLRKESHGVAFYTSYMERLLHAVEALPPAGGACGRPPRPPSAARASRRSSCPAPLRHADVEVSFSGGGATPEEESCEAAPLAEQGHEEDTPMEEARADVAGDTDSALISPLPQNGAAPAGDAPTSREPPDSPVEGQSSCSSIATDSNRRTSLAV
ncbi:hypothetical protein AB1Y20_016220 [Prymnesium parvum]|uniref:Ion transport domain-containing protein n=1 Tax=Prymnesium parvum TaxID=97485 RepID=A0AB34IEQ7_PRYPA